MTLLESTLRQLLNKPPLEAVRRPMSMRQLLDLALKQGIAPDYYQDVLVWTKLRNDVVHRGRRVSRQEAQAVVEGVERIINAI
jgi:hypothetical protein